MRRTALFTPSAATRRSYDTDDAGPADADAFDPSIRFDSSTGMNSAGAWRRNRRRADLPSVVKLDRPARGFTRARRGVDDGVRERAAIDGDGAAKLGGARGGAGEMSTFPASRTTRDLEDHAGGVERAETARCQHHVVASIGGTLGDVRPRPCSRRRLSPRVPGGVGSRGRRSKTRTRQPRFAR